MVVAGAESPELSASGVLSSLFVSRRRVWFEYGCIVASSSSPDNSACGEHDDPPCRQEPEPEPEGQQELEPEGQQELGPEGQPELEPGG